jgi:hypothetical protein
MQQGYGWVWAVGSEPKPKPLGDVFDQIGYDPGGYKAGTPDMSAIFLRLMAVTALSIAAFLLTGRWKAKT